MSLSSSLGCLSRMRGVGTFAGLGRGGLMGLSVESTCWLLKSKQYTDLLS